jgi:uncharacterized membrane protein YcaP (DUF421 family)
MMHFPACADWQTVLHFFVSDNFRSSKTLNNDRISWIIKGRLYLPAYSGIMRKFDRLNSININHFLKSGFMHELLDNNYIRIIGSTLTIYLFIVIAIRLFGKKELAQLSVVDLVFILLISNAVQNAMVGPDSTLSGGLVAASTLFIVNYLLKFLQYRFPMFKKAVQGEATMLVYKGKILDSNMKRVKISEDELMEAVREHSVASLEEVDLAILEVDGEISVLSEKSQHKAVKRRKAHKVLTKQS